MPRWSAYAYVVGRKGRQRYVFGPAWKDVQPNKRRNRYRFDASRKNDLACAVRHMQELVYENVRVVETAGPIPRDWSAT